MNRTIATENGCKIKIGDKVKIKNHGWVEVLDIAKQKGKIDILINVGNGEEWYPIENGRLPK